MYGYDDNYKPYGGYGWDSGGYGEYVSPQLMPPETEPAPPTTPKTPDKYKGMTCTTDSDCPSYTTWEGTNEVVHQGQCVDGKCVYSTKYKQTPKGEKPALIDELGGTTPTGTEGVSLLGGGYVPPFSYSAPSLSSEDEAFKNQLRGEIAQMLAQPGMTEEEKQLRREQLGTEVRKVYQELIPKTKAQLSQRGTLEGGPGKYLIESAPSKLAGDIGRAWSQVEIEDLARASETKLAAMELANQYLNGERSFQLGSSSYELDASRLALEAQLGEAGLALQNLSLSYGFQQWAAEFGLSQMQFEYMVNQGLQGNWTTYYQWLLAYYQNLAEGFH